MLNDTDTPAAGTVRPQDSLGCLSNKLHKDQELHTGEFRFYRKCTHNDRLSAVATPASDRGVLVGVSLAAGHRRRIVSGHRSQAHQFERDSVYVRDFSDDYKADMHGAFDFILIEMSRAFIANTRYERSSAQSGGFSATTGHKDMVLGHFAQVLALTLEHQREASPLFVEQLGVTIGTHIIDQYGGVTSQADGKTRRLSSLQESRAKDMLIGNTQRALSIGEIAAACNLSRSYFIRAFRETTHRTPHRWLLEQRIESARELLKHSDRSLADIAMTCGFSDQSHFSRTFSQIVGTPPGIWRRAIRG
ncbi:AraC family transcriptional regulator [Paraburkholderia sp.]|uniref:helix-turn-helix transcriptional regulator n=1 Tax=Paraburkholderia sp. TaxID=1926495 RepID=UPI0023896AAB|nr:AraC family transcriptional regulator [Paraburkholderia sp.]MDE1179892.1 AraC family transcriptional regulator [Paraburkholderia sp.]